LENPNKKKNWNEKFLSNMKYQSFKRKQYCIELLDNKTYILAYDHDKKEGFMPNPELIYNHAIKLNNDLEKDINKFYTANYIYNSEKTIYKGWSVFDSLISLRQNLDYSYNINENSVTEKQLIELETKLSKQEKKEIIKWCRKYGMPFLGDRAINDYEALIGIPPFEYGFKNDIYTCVKENACICRLGRFLLGLNILCKTLFFYLIYLYKTDNNANFINIDFSKLEVLDDYNISDIKSYVKKALISISDKAIINFDDIIYENKLPHFEPYAETLISLAMYQLAIIMSSKKIYTVKRCKYQECEHFFIPTRNTRKYCMNCSRQKKYKFNRN